MFSKQTIGWVRQICKDKCFAVPSLSCRNTGRVSRVDPGPKHAQATKRPSMPVHWASKVNIRTQRQRITASPTRSSFSAPFGYQLRKAQSKAAYLVRHLESLFTPPLPPPTTTDPFGTPTIYRAPGLRGGDSKWACPCFRPAERDTSWGLEDHIRRRKAEAAGMAFQWPPVVQEPMPAVRPEDLCRYCRGDVQDNSWAPEPAGPPEPIDSDMSDGCSEGDAAEMEIEDIDMDDTPILDTPSTFQHHRYTSVMEVVDTSHPPSAVHGPFASQTSTIAWPTPMSMPAFERPAPQQQPAPEPRPRSPPRQGAVTGGFMVYGGRPANPWGKKPSTHPAPEPRSRSGPSKELELAQLAPESRPRSPPRQGAVTGGLMVYGGRPANPWGKKTSTQPPSEPQAAPRAEPAARPRHHHGRLAEMMRIAEASRRAQAEEGKERPRQAAPLPEVDPGDDDVSDGDEGLDLRPPRFLVNGVFQ